MAEAGIGVTDFFFNGRRYMKRTVGIGIQSFDKIIEENPELGEPLDENKFY